MVQKGSGLGPLQGDSCAVVIGGGPAGAATAISLKMGARALGRDIHVVIVEEKLFEGQQHYNQCVGVLSPPIVELIERDLKVPFPHHLSRNAITGYVLHTARRQIVLDGAAEPSIALRRVQFDAYLLDEARQRDIEVVNARVTGLEFHPDRVVIYTDSVPLEADVVIGAFGLDEGTAMLFQHAVGYHPPPSLSSVVTKFHPGDKGMLDFGERIHAFLPPWQRIEFGALTPKGNHVAINIAGQNIDADLMTRFLAAPFVTSALPALQNAQVSNVNDLRFFKGQFPRGLARKFSGDRYVMVGDAAGLVRAFKGKGITSAVQTGIRAARVILQAGVSERAFGVYHVDNRDIIADLPYGQMMRHLTLFLARSGWMDAILRAAEGDAGLRHALFDSVSAHRPFQDVVRSGLTFDSVRAVMRVLPRYLLPVTQ